MNIIAENADRIARMSSEQVMDMITELSRYLVDNQLKRTKIDECEITWAPEEEDELN